MTETNDKLSAKQAPARPTKPEAAKAAPAEAPKKAAKKAAKK